MHCFCSECYALDENKKLHIYHLYSVIVHSGATITRGHYIAYTRSLEGYRYDFSCTNDNCQAFDCCSIVPKIESSIWYKCDDDKIKAMPQSEFEQFLRQKNITPYVLFYARRDVQ